MLHNKFMLTSLLAIMLIGGAVGYFCYQKVPQINVDRFTTYYNYTPEELTSLSKTQSLVKMTQDKLNICDSLMFDLVMADKIGGLGAMASKIFAYVYVAQRDAAYISYHLHNDNVGSVEPITAKILCHFFPNHCSNIQAQLNPENEKDVYSEKLAEIVFAKVQARIAEDNSNTHPYPVLKGPGYWKGMEPYYGIETGSWKPWLIDSVSSFRAPPPWPPLAPEWNQDLIEMKKKFLNATDEQKKAVVFWAGGPGTITPPGIWLQIGNEALADSDFSFQRIIDIRSVLAMGMADSIISIFDSKYTYWTPRPFMMDNTLISTMPTPNFPGYPADHSQISATAATILAQYFPNQQETFFRLREEASHSRIWGGINLNIDIKTGEEIGRKLGKTVLEKADIKFK